MELQTRRQEAVKILAAVCEAILEVARIPGGAPSGSCYAALMHFDISIDMYNAIIAGMVDAGKITVKNHVIEAVQ